MSALPKTARTILLEQLGSHTPSNDRERAALATMIDFLQRTDSPFDREGGLTHVTASSIVAGTRGTVLHIHRRSGQWLQPGGHIDEGELPAEAARRETLEETGLACEHPDGLPRLLQVDVHVTSNGHTHLDACYLLLAGEADPEAGAGESPTVRWFTWDDAVEVGDAPLASALARARTVWGERAGINRRR